MSDNRQTTMLIPNSPVEEPEETSERGMDPELRAMGRILGWLLRLPDEQSRARVVGYISQRWRAQP